MEATLTGSQGVITRGSDVLTIGRRLDNKLVVSDATVSGRHAEIRPDGLGYSIVDLGSTNGTFVNGQRLPIDLPRVLRSGDTIRVGSFTLTYKESGSAREIDQTQASTPDSTGAAWELRPSESDAQSPAQDPWSLPAQSSAVEGPWSKSPPKSPPDMVPPPTSYPNNPGYPPYSGQEPAYPHYFSQEPASPTYSGQPAQPLPYPGPLPANLSLQKPPLNLAQEQLQFTAFYPGSAPVETWNILLIYAYIQAAQEAVRIDASRFRNQLGPMPFVSDAWASRPLTRGTQITVVPLFRGIAFSPERITFTWTQDWHPANFRFRADRRWAGAVGNGEILIFAGPLIIASLKVSIRFDAQSTPAYQTQEETSASRYRNIFTSYSHADKRIVLAIRKAYEALGDNSFLDVENLRSGQDWNAALFRAIDRSDIFQLFWSSHSAKSLYVQQEYQYALSHYKYEGFIRPIYWEMPMIPPPQEIAHLHFAYYELLGTERKISRFFKFFKRKEARP